MFQEDRKEIILDLIGKNKNITINEISEILKISIPTVYRDLSVLEKENLIKKVYGGIKIVKDVNIELNFYKRLNNNKEKKVAIAREAVKLINENETLALDESSTSYYLAEEIKKTDKKITIITNSVLLPQLLLSSKNIIVISIGGIVYKDIAGFDGSIFINSSTNLIADKFFFSSGGFDENIGTVEIYDPENSVKAKEWFMDISKEAICSVDSSKFDRRGTINLFDIKKIKKIITDEHIDRKIAEVLRSKGIDLIIAKL
ncbi:MAG: DeoR/GlpR family DNA-binding transcription regulator [Actinobacteria bacterium]|nr:DeoR/GlpR family DNA-binding transcription regulator [Actinomycetota bacterium]